jgi:hypothetical protein
MFGPWRLAALAGSARARAGADRLPACTFICLPHCLAGRFRLLLARPPASQSPPAFPQKQADPGRSAGPAKLSSALDRSHAERLAGDKRGLVRGEERDDVGDVGRLAPTAERDRLSQGFPQLRTRERREQRGIGRVAVLVLAFRRASSRRRSWWPRAKSVAGAGY